jgi:hypothetical protein
MERIHRYSPRIDLDRAVSSVIKADQVKIIDLPLGSGPGNEDCAVASRGDRRSREFHLVAFSRVSELQTCPKSQLRCLERRSKKYEQPNE